jgi:hypothetical protein
MQYRPTPLIEHSWVGSALHTMFRAIRCGVPVRWYIASLDENLVNGSPSDSDSRV